MSTDIILHFIFKHNVILIEVLFGASIIAILYLSVRAFGADGNDLNSPDWKQLEENLKKIIEGSKLNKTPGESENSAVGFKIPEGASESAIVQEMQSQLKEVQEKLNQKEQELSQLKDATLSQAATGASSADVAQYEEKIKELESKLNEYSIIEDDIADLSFYKEETVRLQAEIEKLKAQIEALENAAKSAPPPTPQTAPQASTAVPEEKVDIAAAIPSQEPVSVSESNSGATVAEATTSDLAIAQDPTDIKPKEENQDTGFIDNDIMAEFERAVAEQKAAGTGGSTVASKIQAHTQAQEQALATETAASASSTESQSNEAAMAESVPSTEMSNATDNSESAQPIGEMNLDKMLNEAQTLNETVQSGEDNGAAALLEVGMDTDKLLAEASTMEADQTDSIKKIGA